MYKFQGRTPCGSCPYRKDSTLRHWSIAEFSDLLKNEKSEMGTVYGCHKQNGTICKGWLMNQDKNRLPSIALRIALGKANVSREYLESLRCKSPLYETVSEMCYANYPELRINPNIKHLNYGKR